MSNYSYRPLYGCDKQLGSHLVLLHEAIPRPDKDGDRALATEKKVSCSKTSSHCVVYKFYTRPLIGNRLSLYQVVSIGHSYL